MYHIDSKKYKPDHVFMLEKAKDWYTRGIAVNTATIKDVTAETEKARAELVSIGLKNPDAPREVAWFLRSFNSLEIASVAFDAHKGRWVEDLESLEELRDRFSGVYEFGALLNYKKLKSVEKHVKAFKPDDSGLVYPSAAVTSSNRIMYVKPNIIGLPKRLSVVKPFNGYSLVSVDVTAQEPTIFLNWFGGETLKHTDGGNDLY